MNSYIETSLMPGERVVLRASISIWSVATIAIPGVFFLLIALVLVMAIGSRRGAFAVAVATAFPPALFGGLLVLLAYLRYASTECAITNRRVIAKFGFLRRRTIDLDLRKTESLRLEQGILGRILDFGSLVISGAGNPQAPIPGVQRPMEFRKVFLTAQEQANQPPAATS